MPDEEKPEIQAITQVEKGAKLHVIGLAGGSHENSNLNNDAAPNLPLHRT